MTRRKGLAAVVLLAAASTGACGEVPAVPPHGLEVEPLVSAPRGAAIATFHDVRPVPWIATVRKSWTEGRGEGAETPVRRGRARLRLLGEVRATDGGLETRVRVEVVEAEGVAEGYVRRFDGLEATVRHAASGRPDPLTLRLGPAADPAGRGFLRGLWLGGLAGGTPWFPPGPLREGEAWGRGRLGEQAWLAGVAGLAATTPRFRGGGHLVEVVVEDGETWLRIRLDGLVEAEAVRGNEALRQGLRDRGVALVRARDGLPRSWTLREEVRILHRIGDRLLARDITLDVEGELTTAPGDGR